MKFWKRSRETQKGQAILEYLILLSLIIVFWTGVSKKLKEREFFQNMFGTPWQRMANVIEYGVPDDSVQKARKDHPTSYLRHSTRLRQ